MSKRVGNNGDIWTVIDKFTSIDNLLRRQNELLEAMVSGAVASKASPQAKAAPPSNIIIPITPADLNSFLMAARSEVGGVVQIYHYQYDVLISAGSTKVWEKTNPAGSGVVGIYAEDAEINFSYYSSDIKLTLQIAREPISVDTPCVQGLRFPWAVYKPLYPGESVKVTVQNNSASDTHMYPQMVSLSLDKNYYERIYRPMVESGWATAHDWLNFMKQTGEVAKGGGRT